MLCWSLYAPRVGPSCLDTESDAPLTGDRTVVSGECVCTVSFCDGGFYCFGVFMADKREKLVDRERARVDSEEIFRLMRGNGTQSRINDGKASSS